MREKIIFIRSGLKYISAIMQWLANILALETFPKREDYFASGPIDPGQTSSGGVEPADGKDVDRGKPV
jgi:hypothetical protein